MTWIFALVVAWFVSAHAFHVVGLLTLLVLVGSGIVISYLDTHARDERVHKLGI